MRPVRLKPVLYRRNSRDEEFLRISRGFWAPLAQLLDTPHLAGAAIELLQAGLPHCFVVRGDCPGHAQDAAARLLPLVLYRKAVDLTLLTDRCTAPDALRTYVAEQLTDCATQAPMTAERQVLICRALPAGAEDAPLLPALPEGCELPVLVQQWPRQPLSPEAVAALERSAGPVLLLQTDDTAVPAGWPVVSVPAAEDAWYGELLFQICHRGSVVRMDREEAREAANGLLARYHHQLTEQDFALAASYVSRRQGPDLHTNAAFFLQLTAEMPRGTLPCCPPVPNAAHFRRINQSDTLQLIVPYLAVAVWKLCARQSPCPYPHEEVSDLPDGLPAGRSVHNRMHYAPPEEWRLHTPCTLLLAEDFGDREDLYGRRLHDVHSYAELAGAVTALNDHRPDVRSWVLVLDCDPEDLQPEDIRNAPYAFCVDAETLTLYDGPEGLRAFAQAAGELMHRHLHRGGPGFFSRY